MLDSKARKYIQPLFEMFANICVRLKISANLITLISLLIGIASSVVLALTGSVVLSLILFWTSGFADAMDGTIARKTGSQSVWGAVLDIVSDRIVEMGVILALCYLHPENSWSLVILLCSILLSMTLFLSVAAAVDKVADKSFYYQAGLMERTEGFVFFSLMVIYQSNLELVTLIFAGCIVFTAGQRFAEACKLFSQINKS